MAARGWMLLLASLHGAPAAAQQAAVHLRHPDGIAGMRFGAATALVDVDRDGALDLVVGAPGPPAGRVFVYLGPIAPEAGELLPSLELESPMPAVDDRFGHSLGVGDVDGDGRDELVVGAPGWRPGPGALVPRGAAFVFDPDAPSLPVPLMSRDVRASRLGSSIAVGRFTGGDRADVALGAPGSALGTDRQVGAVHVFRLGDGGSELRERILSNPNPCTCGHDMLFGHRVAAGDFDGDGRADLAVSAIFNDVHLPERKLTWPGAGQVFVYLAPLDGTARITIDNPDPGSDPFPAPGIHCSYQRFGQQLLLCDLTGDGHAEVVVGAPRKDADGTCDAGRVFVYAGHGSTPRPRPTLVLTAPFQLAGGLFGFNLAFGRLGGGLLPDLVAGNLNQIQPAIHVWRSPIPDAGAAPWATFPPPVGFGAHYIESLTAGPLGPRRGDPTAERDELILGDPDFGGGAGRVVITFW